MPTPTELATWNPREGPACTEEDFRPDLNASRGTPWNKSVTSVFTQSFLHSDQFVCMDAVKVSKAFSIHLKSLRREYQNQATPTQIRTVNQKKANRAERKRNVSYSPYPRLEDHV